MADNLFEDPRLAAVYDPLDSDRRDLDAYVAVVREVGARSVIDIGCGTGVFACLLADMGLDVVGVDPAEAMLDVARSKPGAERVRWIHGVAANLPQMQVDLVTMTGNVAQVFLDDNEWAATLSAAHAALAPGGTFVFETRRPDAAGWREWNREQSYQRTEVAGFGLVETWNDVTEVALPLVSFRGTTIFHADNTVLTSTSTLRFRTHDELARSLEHAGFTVREVRDAPDRPGKEYIFVATKPE